MSDSKFFYNMGTTVMTSAVANAAKENSRFADEVSTSLGRYFRKDWGEVTEDDKVKNDEAFDYPEDMYVLGSYHTCKGKIFIITNRKTEKPGDNCTTILFAYER